MLYFSICITSKTKKVVCFEATKNVPEILSLPFHVRSLHMLRVTKVTLGVADCPGCCLGTRYQNPTQVNNAFLINSGTLEYKSRGWTSKLPEDFRIQELLWVERSFDSSKSIAVHTY